MAYARGEAGDFHVLRHWHAHEASEKQTSLTPHSHRQQACCSIVERIAGWPPR
jgi:hypothetical protein